MAEKKIDKFTQYIDNFNKAVGDLDKDSIDTNDNGIEVKKNKEDEIELTPGQKSLVWESYNSKVKKIMSERVKKEASKNLEVNEDSKSDLINSKIETLAKYLHVQPSEIEYDYGFYVGDSEWEVLTEDEVYTASVDYVLDNMKDYIWKLADKISLQDFLEMFVHWGGGMLVADIDLEEVADYIVELGLVNKENIFGEKFEGYYIKEL